MKRLDDIETAALAKQLELHDGPAKPLPVAELADVAANAWRHGPPTSGTISQQQDHAIIAVIRDTYRLGLTAGLPTGTAAITAHLTQTIQAALPRLRRGEPIQEVRQLLNHLTIAHRAATQSPVDAATLTELPLPRTYLIAFDNASARVTLDRIAHAAKTAWLHGVEDGWGEAYRTTDRMLRPLQDSDLAATATVAGTPMRQWLDSLAMSAFHLVVEPSRHPAELARLAGPAQTATVIDSTPADPTQATPRRDNTIRRHRG